MTYILAHKNSLKVSFVSKLNCNIRPDKTVSEQAQEVCVCNSELQGQLLYTSHSQAVVKHTEMWNLFNVTKRTSGACFSFTQTSLIWFSLSELYFMFDMCCSMFRSIISTTNVHIPSVFQTHRPDREESSSPCSSGRD